MPESLRDEILLTLDEVKNYLVSRKDAADHILAAVRKRLPPEVTAWGLPEIARNEYRNEVLKLLEAK